MIRSIELKTTLMIQRMHGVVEAQGTHMVLRTPSVPDHWYGNCLAMPGPPRAGDYTRWMDLFAETFPEAAHRVFLVDSPEGDTGASEAFEAHGFEVACRDVLATRTLCRPDRLLEGCEVRPLAGEMDWQAMAETTHAINQDHPGWTRGYLERRVAAIRRAVEQGRGAWWGAWDGPRLLAHMGLFWEGDLVRFQDVETHPDHRGQGLCRTVLYRACQAVQADLGTPLFVINPVDDSVRRIYESVGFSFLERSVDFCRPPAEG